MSDATIRRARPDDVDFLAWTVLAATLSGFDPTKLGSPNAAVPLAAKACGYDDAQLAAAFDRCGPMFECFHEATPGAWIVESVATRPEARGAGLASALGGAGVAQMTARLR